MPRGAKMSTPRCARRPPSRSAPNALQIALAIDAVDRECEQGARLDLDVVARPCAASAGCTRSRYSPPSTRVDRERLRAAAGQRTRQRARDRSGVARNKSTNSSPVGALVARNRHRDSPTHGHREPVAGAAAAAPRARRLSRTAARFATAPRSARSAAASHSRAGALRCKRRERQLVAVRLMRILRYIREQGDRGGRRRSRQQRRERKTGADGQGEKVAQRAAASSRAHRTAEHALADPRTHASMLRGRRQRCRARRTCRKIERIELDRPAWAP